ncbi:unnamed protein product [Ectocarpus sp. CCAP 1310/34]|nr:unnamed protein product [Ectocarpus sp. CCAP 1310/34]
MEEVLSRKEKLAAWRAAKGKPLEAHKAAAAGGGGGGAAGKGAAAAAGRAGKKDVAKGVLQARPGAGNMVNKRTAPPQRKPFQVDTRSIQQASERRVQPGTPIHSLKKRLKRTAVAAAAAVKPAPVRSAPAAAAGGGGSVIPTARAQGKAKAAAAARVPGHMNGVSRSLDSARTKEVSDYLKSQISEANMLLEIAGVDAARTLLGDLLYSAGGGRGVGELALYWAARAKLEEDAGMYLEARKLLDDGEAYISMPTQQKVMAKVVAAFEGRMNARAEADIDRLLEDSVDGLSLNNSAANSNSPASSAPFRYDPNDLSTEDDTGSAQSAIKNLNFSKIAKESGGRGGASVDRASRAGSSTSGSGSNTSLTTRSGASPDWMRGANEEVEEDEKDSQAASSGAKGGATASGEGIESFSGVIYSDDDSDLSVSDIDEGVIARANAFAAEEDARKARMEAEEAGRVPGGVARDVVDDGAGAKDGSLREEDVVAEVPEGADLDAGAAREATAGNDERAKKSGANGDSNDRGVSSTSSSTHMAMAPPPPKLATAAAASVAMAMVAPEPRKRKGTPHPKPLVKRTTPRRGKDVDGEELSPGSFITQVEGTGKDGKRTLTPVRRSRRISGVAKEPTPALLRKEMEAML